MILYMYMYIYIIIVYVHVLHVHKLYDLHIDMYMRTTCTYMIITYCICTRTTCTYTVITYCICTCTTCTYMIYIIIIVYVHALHVHNYTIITYYICTYIYMYMTSKIVHVQLTTCIYNYTCHICAQLV